MSSVRILILAATAAGASPALAQTFPAQPLQMVPRPTPDADALADAMRRLGTNPRDLSALIQAGELSLKLGDVTAAATLFKRADMIDPMNGRVKAGMARILVSQERPGEALRYFDQAAGYGLDPRSFAGDRGLAYDLIGENERAQRDYREALKAGPNDEVQRRYALSLGISGKREEAISAIDTLLRKNDRGAWRAQAFILAMTGDVPGAEKIARTMMPQGMGAALGPFFARLAALPKADRAFAVHFGQLRPTPQRLADAKLTPPLPVLPPEPQAPTQVAAVATPPAAPPQKRSRREEREEARRVQLAQRAAEKARSRDERRVALAQADAARRNARQPGVTFAAPSAVVQPLSASPARASSSNAQGAPVQTASASPQQTPAVNRSAAVPAPQATTLAPRSVQTAANVAAGPPDAPTRLDAPVTAGSAPAQTAAATGGPSAAGLPAPGFSSLAAAPAATGVGATPAPASIASTVASPAPVGGTATAPAAPAPLVTVATPAASSPVAPTAPAPQAVAKMNESSILSRIMAGISIPATELGVPPLRPAPPPPQPEPGVVVATPAIIAAAETARRNAESARAAREAAVTKPTTAATKSGAQSDAAGSRMSSTTKAEAEPTKGLTAAKSAGPDTRAATRSTAAERKAAEAKKIADAKKAEEKKKAAEEARLAKADPPRIWVQVAGGANQNDLPKAWAAVKAKAPALAGKAAYTTPLRATNRVVTGPFKTDAEARAFVNTLAKQGVSAFPFTSAKGQKMTKLDTK